MKYYDNTRLKDAKTCLRYFYFRHKRHWRREGIAAPLVFGASWHSAMDVVWANAKDEGLTDIDLAEMAMKEFAAKWKEDGMPPWSEWNPDLDQKYSPRTPGIAMEMITNYIRLRRNFIRRVKVLAIEKPFAVPLYADNPDIAYVGRRDKDVEEDGRVYAIEHKTTSLYRKATNFASTFIESFSPNSQIDGYTHAGHMEYGDKMAGVRVDAALVHKLVHDAFKVIPVSRGVNQLEAWLYEARFWIRILQAEEEALSEHETNRLVQYLPAYPKNTESCIQYNRLCQYNDICKGWPDPSTHVDPPEGFIVEKWEPFKELELDTIGLPQEA